MRALVVGGTGPTGVPIVNALLRHGYRTTVLHSGRHPAAFDGQVEELLGNARDERDIQRCLGSRWWDVTICTSGRLRLLAGTMAGRTGRFVGVTGQPVYAGTMLPTPLGQLALPVSEQAPRQSDAHGYFGKIKQGEDDILGRHDAGDFEGVIVRYPGIYGARSHLAHEWAVVRRILDQRPVMILPHDGCTYFQRGYVDNVAALVVLAATHPRAPGNAFNAGDERVISARAVAELIRDELESTIDLVGMPAAWCPGVFPLAEKSSLILSLNAARTLLGYRDVVDVETATRRTARYLSEHPLAPDHLNTIVGTFDYDHEDDLVKRWHATSREWDAHAMEDRGGREVKESG